MIQIRIREGSQTHYFFLDGTTIWYQHWWHHQVVAYFPTSLGSMLDSIHVAMSDGNAMTIERI